MDCDAPKMNWEEVEWSEVVAKSCRAHTPTSDYAEPGPSAGSPSPESVKAPAALGSEASSALAAAPEPAPSPAPAPADPPPPSEAAVGAAEAAEAAEAARTPLLRSSAVSISSKKGSSDLRWFLQETRGAHKHGHKKRCGLTPVCMAGGRLRCVRDKLLGARVSLCLSYVPQFVGCTRSACVHA
jgi:hypothetical protein